MPWRKKEKPEVPPAKLLLWVALATFVFGALGFGQLLEDMLRAARNNLHTHSASGDIVLVKIDDRAVNEIGRWPWPRAYHAQLIDRLTAAGAARIYFDIAFESRGAAEDDQRLADALERSGRVVLPVRTQAASRGATVLPLLAERAELASISVKYNYHNAVWKVRHAARFGSGTIPSLASKLADSQRNSTDMFPVDYSIDPLSIPAVSAAAILKGTAEAGTFAGKHVVIGTDAGTAGDRYFIPGSGQMAGAYVHLIAAETLKAGTPRDFGWIPASLLALAIAAFALRRRSARQQNAVLGGGAAAILALSLLLDAQLLFVDIVPGLFAIVTVAGVLGWRRFRQRGLVNASSGLPNLSALRAFRNGRGQTLVGARIINYAEIVASLPADSERQLVEQVVSRLSAGASGRTFYHGDGGIFAWFEDSRAGVAHHIEALSALFRAPVRIGELAIDLVVSFGVDFGSSRSIANRLGSALVAAEEAVHEGLKWKYYDPEALQNAAWRLSMLSQLDSAIDKGEVWIAFQPQVDLATRRTIGAEALARWTHPEKGPIAASEFVAAAEQHDRIAKLTLFVLDKAIAAAASVNRAGFDFDIAVNLSGRLLGDKSLIRTVSQLLDTHGLAPQRLTLELTETAALAGSGEAVEMLSRLRELGVRISIDDYGTGLSTLDYLKKIPAGEIKIDQSFVRGLCENRSDRLMVQSTIALAHSLGRKVVAEGVEQMAVLDALAEMECDVAQGFIVGRPSSLESVIRRLTSEKRREVA